MEELLKKKKEKKKKRKRFWNTLTIAFQQCAELSKKLSLREAQMRALLAFCSAVVSGAVSSSSIYTASVGLYF